MDINDCEENPCLNDGTCVDLVDGYKCNCLPGYEGKNCQHTSDDCKSEPCQNGASCVDELDGYLCKCRPGFVGLQCEGMLPSNEIMLQVAIFILIFNARF